MQRASSDDNFNDKLEALLDKYEPKEEFINEVQDFSRRFLDEAFFVDAFTDYGINSSLGFFSELFRRIKYKILPPLSNNAEIKNYLLFLFENKVAAQWLYKAEDKNKARIYSLFIHPSLVNRTKINAQVKNALVVLSHRMVTLGVDPYIVKKLPEVDDIHSPFFELNRAINDFAETPEEDTERIDSLCTVILIELKKCRLVFQNLEERKDEMGTSLHLTFLIRRAQQHAERIENLVQVFSADQRVKYNAIKKLSETLLRCEYEKYSVRKFIKTNTGLLAYRVMSHTSDKGEHYIGFSKDENKKLFLSAMGGGAIVILLVLVKHFIHQLHLSLFFEGLLFGLNYGIGFVLMHLLHLTLATKQPAMTASYIARSINQSTGKTGVAKVLKQIVRSQFVSLAGNLIVVLPLSVLIGWLVKAYAAHPLLNPADASKHLYSNHPFLSASLFYAAVTGVFLTLSGLVTGYYDNKVVFSDFAERIKQHPKWKKIYSKRQLGKAAGFVEKNSGAIIGNMFLGLCLGMAGNIGKFMGLPFDIRHVTVSAGNFGLSLGSMNIYPIAQLLTVFAGILLIGLINIFSSFLLSFSLACISRNISAKQSLRILYDFLLNRK